MRALSIRPPWATAIFNHGKHVENRRWIPPHLGTLAIHVTKGIGRRSDFNDDVTEVVNRANIPEQVVLAESRTRSAIIGVVDLFAVCSAATPGGSGPSGLTEAQARDVVEAAASAGFTDLTVDDLLDGRCRCGPWAAQGQHHLMLTNIRRLPVPVPAAGMLGLWKLDPATQAAVENQLVFWLEG